MSKDSKPTPSVPSASVPPVRYTFPSEVLAALPVESSVTKCTPCKGRTEKHWVKISPINVLDPESNPLETLKLTKRMLICTNCGNLQLTN